MHTYQYQPGDRPLEGYTIKSAAGHGGFGEVYYAVSDSGREVALKAVQGYEQIELRGIRQCMNLKNPHLVTIFDVKHNEKGQPFVLMEYVAGPSLRDLIDESPNGLGPQKTAFFLREIAKGLSYLHDCGIVHRDLKPANIFYEDGYVKIGDYGLSKAISADHHQSQTVTVGTVHYMAPEVGAGRYDRSIDIYALGVVVYEMLTGGVPFKGASPSEILMKHLSAKPELDAVEEPFREAINRAMAKDPNERYQSVNEMVETVFGEERLKQSMAGYSAVDLSMAAAHVGKKVHVGGGGSGTAVHEPRGAVGVQDQIEDVAHRIEESVDRVTRQIDQKFTGRRVRSGARGGAADPSRDTMTSGQRRVLSAIAMLVVALGSGLLAGSNGQEQFNFMLLAVAASAGAKGGLRFAHARLIPSLTGEPALIRRLTVAGTATFFSGLVAAPLFLLATGKWNSSHTMTLVTLALPLFLMDWSKRMSPGRADRVSFGAAISAGLLGWLTSIFVNDASTILAIGIPAAVMLAVQARSPFDPTVTEDWACEDDENKPIGKPLADRVADAAARNNFSRTVRGADHPLHKTEQVNAYSAVVTAKHSPKSRLVALLLAAAAFLPVFPVFGLHRFYAGKVGTGILWLLTFGLLGIGQLVDLILIAAGSFNDVSGRPMTVWQPENNDAPVRPGERKPAEEVRANALKTKSKRVLPPLASAETAELLRWPLPPRQAGRMMPSFFSIVFSLIASLMLFAGLLIALPLGLQLPEAISANVVASGLGAELDRAFGYEGWPNLFHSVGLIVSLALLILGGLLLTIARRSDGVLHMLRALLGGGGLLLAALCGTEMLSRWDAVNRVWKPIAEHVQADRVGPAIEAFLSSVQGPPAIFALLFLFGSILVLAWPPKRRELYAPPMDGEGVKP
jgi:TM2 domain-containing membrane protein YozV